MDLKENVTASNESKKSITEEIDVSNYVLGRRSKEKQCSLLNINIKYNIKYKEDDIKMADYIWVKISYQMLAEISSEINDTQGVKVSRLSTQREKT